MKRHAFATFLLLACAFGAAGIASMVRAETRSQGQAETLRVVTMPLEPFVIADGDRLADFSVDLWDAVAKQLGVQYQWVKVESVKVFGLSLLVLLVTAHIIWLVERGSNDAIPRAYLPGIWESLWWSLATLSTHEYGVLGHSRARSKRLLAMVVVVISVVLIAQFTASVTASLTVH
jgi:hypothetical protein